MNITKQICTQHIATKCHKLNNCTSKVRSAGNKLVILTIHYNDVDEAVQAEVAVVHIADSYFITLKLN